MISLWTRLSDSDSDESDQEEEKENGFDFHDFMDNFVGSDNSYISSVIHSRAFLIYFL